MKIAATTVPVFATAFLATMTLLYIYNKNSDSNKPKPLVFATASQGELTGSVFPEAGIFWGIPYSQPPVGYFRWRDPRDAIKFPGGRFNATYKRSSCPQYCNNPAPRLSCPVDETSEDCLNLNVFVPRSILKPANDDVTDHDYVIDTDKSLAVMVWFHGGNFRGGAGSVPIYDSRFLANFGNVVVVTINYRLEALGYLVHGEGDDAAEGNYGIKDQIKALQWIQKNIKYFGGNPNKVTLFGQSAGGESIGILMSIAQGSGLFQQAIMQSNPFGLPFRTKENALLFGNFFVENVGCTVGDMECLRNVSKDQVEYGGRRYRPNEDVGPFIYRFQPWSPVINTEFLPRQPLDVFMEGKALDIPVIVGNVKGEGVSYVAGEFPFKIPDFMYKIAGSLLFKPEDLKELLEQYPPKCSSLPLELIPSCDNRPILYDIVTNFVFVCPQKAAVKSFSNSWLYDFDVLWSFDHLWEQKACVGQVCHATDIPFVFDMETLTDIRMTKEEKNLAKRVQRYWTNFAKYGNPNGPQLEKSYSDEYNGNGNTINAKLPEDGDLLFWPQFNDSANYRSIYLRTIGDEIRSNIHKENCDFIDKIGYQLNDDK